MIKMSSKMFSARALKDLNTKTIIMIVLELKSRFSETFYLLIVLNKLDKSKSIPAYF